MINIPEEEIFDEVEYNWLIDRRLEMDVIDAIAKALIICPIRFNDFKLLIENCEGDITPNLIETFARSRTLIMHIIESDGDDDEQISEIS